MLNTDLKNKAWRARLWWQSPRDPSGHPQGRNSVDGVAAEKVQTANPSTAKLYS